MATVFDLTRDAETQDHPAVVDLTAEEEEGGLVMDDAEPAFGEVWLGGKQLPEGLVEHWNVCNRDPFFDLLALRLRQSETPAVYVPVLVAADPIIEPVNEQVPESVPTPVPSRKRAAPTPRRRIQPKRAAKRVSVPQGPRKSARLAAKQ